MVKMKDSGIEWIGQIPEDWSVERFQWHLDEIVEKNNPIKTTNVLSLTNKLGVVPYEEKGNQGNKAKENHDEYKIAYPNTIVANSMNILIGSVGISDYYGCVSPVYYVFRAKEGECLEFMNYIMQTRAFQKELRKYANGILEIRLRVSADTILKQKIAIPDIEIQRKIVTYLNATCSKIDAVSADIQEQIRVLEDYRKSVISEAVTKGLDKNVPMKDSGIDWIGEIPADWDVIKFKYTVDFLGKGNGITKEQVYEDGDIQCVRYGELYSKYENHFDISKSRTFESRIPVKVYAQHGDLLFAGTGELIEEIGKNIMYDGSEPCLVGGDIIIAKHHQNPYFLNYAMNSHSSQEQKSNGKAKLKVVHISAREIGNVWIALPPKPVQDKIADILNEIYQKIDLMIATKCEQLDILNKYKQPNKYEYVTGKKEVV